MRKTAEILETSHSTISRYKANVYKKRQIDINNKYDVFFQCLYTHYDYKTCSIEICVMKFKKSYLTANCPSIKQVYNWINEGKIKLTKKTYVIKKTRKENNDVKPYKVEYRP